jgi:hypothetical protein
MNTGQPVFAQLMSLIHPEVFHRCCDGRDPQKGTEHLGESPPNSPEFERQRIRESSNRSTTYETAPPHSRSRGL